MDSVFLSASSLPRLSLLVLTLAMGGYFATRPQKAPGTLWFVGLFAGAVLHHAAFFGMEVAYAPWGRTVLAPLSWVGAFLSLWSTVGIGYRFLGAPYPRESRAVLTLGGLVAIGVSVWLIAWYAEQAPLPGPAAPMVGTVLLMVFSLVSAAVMARRGWRPIALDAADRRPHLERRAFRAFGAVLLLGILIPVSSLLRNASMLSGSAAEQIALVVWAVALMAILTIYANYVPEPTSLLVRVVGFAFLTIVTALGIASVVAFPDLSPSAFETPRALLEADEARALPFAALMMGAGLFTLLAFPLFLREGLTRPLARLLDGVRRAARGHLDVEVPVGALDEVGLLTGDFNRMTGSLRLADAALRDYTETLEDRVEARTAELAASLDALKAAQARLVQQEKLASLGQLTAGIAHEIKNPLNFVTNFAGLSGELVDELATETDPAERQAILDDLRANAVKIEMHGRRADAIVRSMMEHARSGTGERRTVDLNALVAEQAALALDMLRTRQPDADIALDLHLDPSAGTVELAPQEIGRVLLNLIGNAFDAVRPLDTDAKPAVRVSTARRAGAVQVTVADNGTGMSAEVQRKVFEPFFTTKPTGEGTGLGLSLSHDIVVQGHGGTLDVESAEGEGATFTLTLP